MERVLVLDVENNTTREVEISDDITTIYRELGCDVFDIANRKIGDRRFDIFCDDIGLFRDEPIVSAINADDFSPMLVGNLLFANHDSEGRTVGLTDEDVAMIRSNIAMVVSSKRGDPWMVGCCDW